MKCCKVEKNVDLGLIPLFEDLKKQGKIKFLGFSFHDAYDAFEEMVNTHKWDFCHIQYNYMDTDVQAGNKGYALAEKLGIPIVIMEPIKGGQLAALPQDIEDIFKQYDFSASIASWAFRWVASKPNVLAVLSGMTTYEQVEDNLKTFGNFKPLNQEEEGVVEKVAATIKSRQLSGCTACAYCMPCPFGVNIPKNFQYWNEGAMYQNVGRVQQRYNGLEENARASNCQQCGQCETMCPQHIQIREDLKRVAEYMSVK